MNEAEMEHFRKALLHLKSELEEQENATGENSDPVELDQSRVGRLSRMDAMQVHEMALDAARRRQQKLEQIAGALRRMEAGEYGYCFICGNEIGVRRLSIDPTYTRCMECINK